MNCPFCEIKKSRIVTDNEIAFVVRDFYPVTEMHSLIIPFRHESDYFKLTKKEIIACHGLLLSEKNKLQSLDTSILGFNVGINCGKESGQTVMHTHIHLIPRRLGDQENPTGGVRGVIPEKQKY